MELIDKDNQKNLLILEISYVDMLLSNFFNTKTLYHD